LGDAAGVMVTTANNVICIGAPGNNVDNSCYIGNIFSSTVTESAVFVNSNGRLGTMTSSKRFKEHIKPMDKASEALYSLKPVSFRYKKEFDPAGTSQLGLVAEDVEKIASELVVRDKDGKAYSVRYDQVNAMLLNEFLKEHRKVEEQSCEIVEQRARITELKKGMATVVAQLEEQAVQIQKVSAQLETSKPAPQVANNP
jgi:Chaperone of endosialidase